MSTPLVPEGQRLLRIAVTGNAGTRRPVVADWIAKNYGVQPVVFNGKDRWVLDEAQLIVECYLCETAPKHPQVVDRRTVRVGVPFEWLFDRTWTEAMRPQLDPMMLFAFGLQAPDAAGQVGAGQCVRKTRS